MDAALLPSSRYRLNRPSREPSGAGTREARATKPVIGMIGHGLAPTFFWGGEGPPGRTQQHRDSLDPDGWLARFVRSQMIEKPGAVQAGRRSAVVGVGFTRRHRGKPLCQDIVSPVDTGRLMGGPFGSVGVDTRADYCDVARRRTVDRLGIKIEPVQVRFR